MWIVTADLASDPGVDCIYVASVWLLQAGSALFAASEGLLGPMCNNSVNTSASVHLPGWPHASVQSEDALALLPNGLLWLIGGLHPSSWRDSSGNASGWALRWLHCW